MRCIALTAIFILILISPAFAELKSDIEYGKADGDSLKLDVSVPDGVGPFPVAVIVHGGGWSGGDKEQDITPLFQPLTDAHFTWFTINYRLAPAHRWPACIDDVRSAIRWVKAHAAEYKGDANHIALIGHSAGGHLVCLAAALADADVRVQVIVGLAPVTDFEQDLEQRGGLSTSLQALLNRPKEVTDESRKLLHDLSPINHIVPGLPPFLVIQGSADKTVPYQQSLNFQAKLKASGDVCDLVTVQGAPHKVTDWDKFDASYKEKMIAWLAAQFAATATTQPAASMPVGQP